MPELTPHDRGRGAWTNQGSLGHPVRVQYDRGPCTACGAHPTRMFRDGLRCIEHTPARIAGRAEPPTPDPARSITGLRHRETPQPRETNHDRYGNATDTPRYRGGRPVPD